MKFLAYGIVSGLLSHAACSPIFDVKRDLDGWSLPSSVPTPPKGECAVIVMAGVTSYPTFGSKRGDTTDPANADASAALMGTGPWIAVLGSDRTWVYKPEDFKDEKSGYGFQTTLQWSGHTLVWKAPYIGIDETDWDATYSFDGTDYTCNGHKCNHYDTAAPMTAMTYHVGQFKC